MQRRLDSVSCRLVCQRLDLSSVAGGTAIVTTFLCVDLIRARTQNAPCDVEETCSGTSAQCPRDSYAGAERVCRVGTSACDASELCDGLSPGEGCPRAPTRLA